MKFKIFPKSSASPTLIIKTENQTTKDGKPIVIKMWIKKWENNKLPYFNTVRALAYERKIYEAKILPIIMEGGEKVPFFKYLGSGCKITAEQFAEFIGVEHGKESEYIFYGTLKEYVEEGNTSSSTLDEKELREAYASLSSTELEQLKNEEISCMMYPYVNYLTFDDYITRANSKELLEIFEHVVRGIYIMYKNRTVHNDLHSDNILIERETGKVMIFDFDRAYSPDIGDNPLLNTNKCGNGLCSYAQCNIYNDGGYAIDFFKILQYMTYRKDFKTILSKLNVNNRIKFLTKRTWILKSLKELGPFFNYEKECSYLQYPDYAMAYISKQFGTIDEILYNLTGSKAVFRRSDVVSAQQSIEVGSSQPVEKSLTVETIPQHIEQFMTNFPKISNSLDVQKQNSVREEYISILEGQEVSTEETEITTSTLENAKPKNIVEIILANEKRKFPK